MKKIPLFCIILLSVLLPGSCSKESGTSGNAGGSPAFKAAVKKWALPAGWDENPYNAWIDGVWDSNVLPNFVPKEIEGVKAEQTSYHRIGDSSFTSSYSSGNMEFKDGNYESWGLVFYCNEKQELQFVKQMETNGFLGGISKQGDANWGTPSEYEWTGNGYYAYLRVNNNALGEEGYSRLAMFSITPVFHKLPKSFFGTTLPQAGIAFSSYDDWEMYAYDQDYNEIEAEYNLASDKGKLPPYYAAWFDYYCTTSDDMKAYTRQMKSQGWEITYEYQDEHGGYNALLRKGDMHAVVMRDGSMRVGFANVPEMLSY